MSASHRISAIGAVPEALEVERFAQARIQEIEFLDAAVAAVSRREDGVSRAHQDAVPVSSTAGGLRDQSETLPRHLRRRTTSHKPRRMSVALKNRGNNRNSSGNTGSSSSNSNTKKAMQKPKRGGTEASHSLIRHASGNGVPKDARHDHSGKGFVKSSGDEEQSRRCRKHRRRPRALLEMHWPHARVNGEAKPQEENGNIPRWLESHIWHAKRMHMQEKWGFMLPVKSNRGPRMAVEAALKHCTLQDVTFLRPLEMHGRLRDLLGLLSTVMDPLDERPRTRSCLAGYVEASSFLYRVNEFPLGCIAPVSILWSPDRANTFKTSGAKTEEVDSSGEGRMQEEDVDFEEEKRRVWLWIHPAAEEEAMVEIRKACTLEGAPWVGEIQAGPVPGGLCRLRVRGTRAHDLVQQVLRTAAPAPGTSDETRLSPATVTPHDHVNETLGFHSSTGAASGGSSEGVSFEDAALENGSHWRTLVTSSPHSSSSSPGESSTGSGGKAVAVRDLPTGSVLAITALDPRERPSLPPRHARTPLAPSSSRTSTVTHGGSDLKTRKKTANAGRRRDDGVVDVSGPDLSDDREEATVRSKGVEASTLSASASGRASTPALSQAAWPPHWAPISPLWDPDARRMSVQLAEARPDHVINRARRCERARAAWDGDAAISAAATGTTPTVSSSINPNLSTALKATADRGTSYSGGGVGGSNGSEGSAGVAPVILIWSSGIATKAHGGDTAATDLVDAYPAASAAAISSHQNHDEGEDTDYDADSPAGDRSRGTDNYGGVRKEGKTRRKGLEKKLRMVGQGWDLVLSAGWAPVFFHALVMAGARAISLSEADSLALETTEPCFPADFPDTSAGRRHWDEVGQKAAAAWTKTRPKHRGFKLPPKRSLQSPPSPQPPPPQPRSTQVSEGVETRDREGITTALFQPDFRELAGVLVFTVESEEKEMNVSTGMRSAAVDSPSENHVSGNVSHESGNPDDVQSMDAKRVDNDSKGGKIDASEPFAVARGFQYARAFLPGETGEDSGGNAPAPPPPLQLAFPTFLAVRIFWGKGISKAGSLLYSASPLHHELWIRGERVGKPWPGFSTRSATRSPEYQPFAEHAMDSRHASLENSKRVDSGELSVGRRGETSMSSQSAKAPPLAHGGAIGSVTSAGFSFLRGGGAGRGVCEAVAVRDALFASLMACGGRNYRCTSSGQQAWALVLVGNHARDWWRPAIMSISTA